VGRENGGLRPSDLPPVGQVRPIMRRLFCGLDLVDQRDFGSLKRLPFAAWTTQNLDRLIAIIYRLRRIEDGEQACR
jgi:hypothetical protein